MNIKETVCKVCEASERSKYLSDFRCKEDAIEYEIRKLLDGVFTIIESRAWFTGEWFGRKEADGVEPTPINCEKSVANLMKSIKSQLD